jgi:hypothetical protein
LSASSSSQTQRRQNTQENNKKKKPKEGRELTFKLSLCLLIFGSHFCPLAFALLFQVLPLGIFFFLNIRGKKQKNHREEKNAEKGGSLSSSSCSTFSLLALASALLLLHFYFNCFLLTSSFQTKEKKNTQRKNKP